MTANTPKTRKARGRKCQQEVRDMLREHFSSFVYDAGRHTLVDADIESRGMGQSGVDIILSPEAKRYIPWDIEVKAKDRLDIWGALKQTETNTEEGRVGLLCFKRSRGELYACLKLSDLLRLI